MRLRLALHACLFAALTFSLLHLDDIALAGIGFYRQEISPALGMQCGYARAGHGVSCSAYARQMIAENGWLRGAILSRSRFLACSRLAQENH